MYIYIRNENECKTLRKEKVMEQITLDVAVVNMRVFVGKAISGDYSMMVGNEIATYTKRELHEEFGLTDKDVKDLDNFFKTR